jgi:GNAT superfamily N-acetyltransferase
MSLGSGLHGVAPGYIASVVTHLEMRAKPALRAEAAEVGLRLDRVKRAAPEWYRALFREIGAAYLWFGRLEIDDAALCAILHDPLVEVYRVLEGEAEVGLLELDFREAGACELAYFGLIPGFAGRGAGRWMMNRAIELAGREGVARFWVHTCSLDHPAALEFYRRSGFVAFAREVEVSRDPRLRGLLPEEAAPGVPILR